MDYVKLVYASILLIGGILIFFAPLFQKGDERKQFIKSKAQSYAFTVVMGVFILNVAQSIYFTIQGEHGNGGSPLVSMTLISIIYLVTLLVYGRKYGN